jgi:O-antigen/teichoic acid export membrane protein
MLAAQRAPHIVSISPPLQQPATEPVQPVARSLRLNLSWTMLGNVVYATSQWAIVVLLARLGTPALVGQYALGLAIAVPVTVFAAMQLRQVQATDARGRFEFRDYLGLGLTNFALALPLILVFLQVAGYSAERVALVMAVAGARVLEDFSEIVFGMYQRYERMDRIAVSQLLKGPLTLALVAAALFMRRDIALVAAALFVGRTLVILLYELPTARRLLAASGEPATLRPRADLTRQRALAKLALPLGITTLLLALQLNVPRYFLEQHWGEAQLGIYAALGSLLTAGSLVMSALSQTASPRLARLQHDGNLSDFRRVMLKLIGLALVLGAVGMLVVVAAGRPIAGALYGAQYADHAGVLVWMMAFAAVSFVGTVLGTALTALQVFAPQPWAHAVVLLVIALSAALLIPGHGIYGAAWALLIGVSLSSVAYALFIAAALRSRRQ